MSDLENIIVKMTRKDAETIHDGLCEAIAEVSRQHDMFIGYHKEKPLKKELDELTSICKKFKDILGYAERT